MGPLFFFSDGSANPMLFVTSSTIHFHLRGHGSAGLHEPWQKVDIFWLGKGRFFCLATLIAILGSAAKSTLPMFFQ
jgi:hypothetical protein